MIFSKLIVTSLFSVQLSQTLLISNWRQPNVPSIFSICFVARSTCKYGSATCYTKIETRKWEEKSQKRWERVKLSRGKVAGINKLLYTTWGWRRRLSPQIEHWNIFSQNHIMNRRFFTIHRNYTHKFSHQSKRRDTRLRIAGMSQVSINKTRQLLWIFISRSVALCSAVNDVNDVYSISRNCRKMAKIQTKFSIGQNELLNSSIKRIMKSKISCWLASMKTQCLIFC